MLRKLAGFPVLVTHRAEDDLEDCNVDRMDLAESAAGYEEEYAVHNED